MKARIKIHAITYRGASVQITKEIECPDFEEIIRPERYLGKIRFPAHTISVEEQIDDWYETVNKTDLMYENDLMCIVDWNVLQTSKGELIPIEVLNSILVVKFVQENDFSEQLKVDFQVVYKKMHETIKDLTAEKQIMIVLNTMGIGYEAATAALKHLMEYQKSLEGLSLAELEQLRSNNEVSNETLPQIDSKE